MFCVVEVKKIECIKAVTNVGEGTKKDTFREITQYWFLEGVLFSVHNPIDDNYEE